jgi:hypothetical protein
MGFELGLNIGLCWFHYFSHCGVKQVHSYGETFEESGQNYEERLKYTQGHGSPTQLVQVAWCQSNDQSDKLRLFDFFECQKLRELRFSPRKRPWSAQFQVFR